MVLEIQIYSLGVSFLYGIFFFILLEINSKFIYSSNMFIKVICSFLFAIFNALLYFIILMYINNGYIHLYFFLCIILGYICSNFVYKMICKK